MAVEIKKDYSQHNGRLDLGRIGVLMGGPSTEREISLKSGKAVFDALKQLELEVEAIRIETNDPEENRRLLKSYNIDCAFIALHGKFGEDGGIQEILESINIAYTGSGIEASRLAMDKIASLGYFARRGLNTGKFIVADKSGPRPKPDLGFPLVIKPASHGSSIGLSIIKSEKDLGQALDLAFQYDDRVILQEYIKGRELTVGVLEERPLAVIEIVPKRFFFDYEAKYQQGLTDYIVPAKLEASIAEKAQEAGLAAHKALGCYGCSRADIILTAENQPFILEINTIPGMTATSLLPKAAGVAGLNFGQLCVKLIQLAYAKK